jgi:type II secretory pathway component GspD/PulD (secretin)
VAADLLNQILGNGGDGGGGGGSLLGDLASGMMGGAGGGLMGSLLGLGGGGGGITTSGSVTITPDSRLNALVVQAGPQDLDLVEQMLEIIDQEDSPEDIQTVAKPRLIPVFYSKAEDIASVVKSVYASRLDSAATSGRQRQPSPEEFMKALRGGGGKGGGRSSGASSTPQKMSVGVDARSNSLVVSAPEKLFKEVKLLVEQLDQAGTESQQDVRVVTLKRSNPATVQQALQSLLGDSVESGSGSNGTSKTKGGTSKKDEKSEAKNAAAANEQMRDQIRRRVEFFNNLQRGGGGSPGGGGFGRGDGGGSGRGSGGGRPGSGGGRPGGGRPGGR